MFKYFYKLITDNKVPTLASGIAFNIILNGGAFLFLYIIVSRYFDNSLINQLVSRLEDGDLKDLFEYFIDYQNNINYSFFLIITSIYSASSLYYHFINVIELLTKRSYKINISKRLISIIITFVFLIGLNIISVVLIEIIGNRVGFRIVIVLVIILLVLLILFVINSYSIKSFKIKKIWKGILFSLFYLFIFSIGFMMYLRVFSNFKVIYGVLSFIFIFCFYIYSICIGILIGICINVRNNLII